MVKPIFAGGYMSMPMPSFTGGTCLRLASYVGMVLGVYFMFIDMSDEFRCDKSDELWSGAAGPDQCLLPRQKMSTAAWHARAESFEKKRLEIITHANQQKLKVELESQIEQAEGEAEALKRFANQFTDECYAHTRDYINDVWEYENGVKRHVLNVTSTHYNDVSAATLAMTPFENGADLCHTATSEKYLEDQYNQCPEWHFSTGELVKRGWVVSQGSKACNETLSPSKQLKTVGADRLDQLIEEAMTEMLADDACGNTMWIDGEGLYCVEAGYECVDTTTDAIRLEHKADHMNQCGFQQDVRYDQRDLLLSMNGTDGWNAANFTWYCQYLCFQRPACMAFSRGPEGDTMVCELFTDARPIAGHADWVSGSESCPICQDTVAGCENNKCHDPDFTPGTGTIADYRAQCQKTCGYCETKGIHYDMRCGWKLSCDDTEAQQTCGSAICPNYAPVTTTTKMWTTTEGPAHQNANTTCLFSGDILLRLRVNTDTVDHDEEGSLIDDYDPRFEAEWNATGAGYGTKIVEFKLTVAPVANSGDVKLSVTNMDTGALVVEDTKLENAQMAVDCKDLGGCGYSGQVYIGCQETRAAGVTNQSDIVVNMNGCYTTPTDRWNCIQTRLSELDTQHTAARSAINSAWSAINTTMEEHLSVAYESIKLDTFDFTANVLQNMKEINSTRNTVALLDEEILKVQEEKVAEIEHRYDEYTVDIGERYRVGCAHKSGPNNWGLGTGKVPNDATHVNDFIKNSADFNDFLLHECDSAAAVAHHCSSDSEHFRKDVSMLWGAGEDPLKPPMKMPQWHWVSYENRPLEDRHTCLDTPCLLHKYSLSCKSMALGQLVWLTAQSGKHLCVDSAWQPVTLPDGHSGVHGWYVVEANASDGMVNLVHEHNPDYMLALHAITGLAAYRRNAIEAGEADPNFAMVDAGDARVYLQGNQSLVLVEGAAGVAAQQQWGDASKWWVRWMVGGMEHDCNSTYNADSGHRVGVQWLSHCDEGSITLGRERWSWTHDPNFVQPTAAPTPAPPEGQATVTVTSTTMFMGIDGAQAYSPQGNQSNQTGSWGKVMNFNVSCVAPYAAMTDKWMRWQAGSGKKLRERLESEAYDRQFDIMQEAWKSWKNWETGQSVYAETKTTVQECARDVNGTGMPAADPGFLTSGFRAFGHKSFECGLAQCDVDQCLKTTTKCRLGESLDEVEFECVDRIRVSKKRVDELLIGIFGFLLSVLIFACSFCTDDPASAEMRGLPMGRFGRKGAKAASNEVVVIQGDGPRGAGVGGSDDEEENLHKRGKHRGQAPPIPAPPKKEVPGQVESNKDR